MRKNSPQSKKKTGGIKPGSEGPATQKQVAQNLGLHQTTVSYILSGRATAKFSSETRERVLREARRLGYRVSAPARLLRGGRSGLIGMFHFGRGDMSTTGRRLDEILHAITRMNYRPMAIPMAPEMLIDAENQKSACEVLMDVRVEGLVISGFSDRFDRRLLGTFKSAGIPMVSVTGVVLPGIPFFGYDRAGSVKELTRHLIERGRKRLVFLGSRQPTTLRQQGYQNHFAAESGFVEVTKAHGLKGRVVEQKRRTNSSSESAPYQEGEELMVEAWSGPRKPDGVICYDDRLAAGVYRFCHTHGIEIPEQLAVVGYGNQPFGEFLGPNLTTVTLPTKEAASAAVQLLVERIRNGWSGSSNIRRFLPCPVIPRESSAAAGSST